MDQDDQGNNHDALEINPLKRRRGRPRKYPRPNVDRGENAVTRDENLIRRDNAPIPPGFAGANDNQPHQANPNNNANDVAVGQVVHGVIEASFEAGYLLAVKLGDSENSLRGVVFKPGHYAPVRENNDVAPNVPMVRRNEVPLPPNILNQAHGSNPRSNRNGIGNWVVPKVAKGRHASPVPIQIAHPVPRDKVVPVVLQPVNLPNGGTVANQPSPVSTPPVPPETSKGKQVQDADPSNATGVNQEMPKSVSEAIMHHAEVNMMNLPAPQFEHLQPRVTNVVERKKDRLQSDETNTVNIKNETSDMDQPLSVEPLQAVLPDRNSPASLLKPFENFRTGKMTELLRAVQENMMENQEPTIGSRPRFEAEQKDEENGHPQAPPSV